MSRSLRLLVLVSLFMIACGASARERTIKTTLTAVNQTRDAFIVFDRAAQAGIVAAAPSYERGAAALQAYRAQRELVVEGFAAAYRAIAIAATVNDDPSLATMLGAAQQIATALHLLKQKDFAP